MTHPIEPPPSTRHLKEMLMIAAITAIGGLLCGYNTGIIGIALLGLSKQFALTIYSQQFITSSTILGALIGCMIIQPFADYFGKRPIIIVIGLLFIFSALACAISPNVTLLIIFRFMLGLPIGGASQIIPVYIAELSLPERRGKMVVLFQIMLVLGITLAYFIGLILGDLWQWMFGLAVIPALMLLIGMFVLPESPRWLVLKKRPEQAFQVLCKVRCRDEIAHAEVKAIEQVSQQAQGTWKDLFEPWIRPSLVVGISLAMFCQITGNNALVYYAPIIFTQAGFSHEAAIIGTGISIFLILIMTMIGSVLVDKIGRRRYLLWTIPWSILALIAMGYLFMDNHIHSDFSKILILICLAVYMIFNCGGFGVCLWLINSEIYPLFIRGKGASLSTFSTWFFTLIISLTTLSLVTTLGATYSFWLFALISIIAVVFIYFLVPETKGKTLEEIEMQLKEHRFYYYQHRPH